MDTSCVVVYGVAVCDGIIPVFQTLYCGWNLQSTGWGWIFRLRVYFPETGERCLAWLPIGSIYLFYRCNTRFEVLY